MRVTLSNHNIIPVWLCCVLCDAGYLEPCEEIYCRHVQGCEEETEAG